MRILNLYAGLGGNCNLWDDINNEIVNIELDEKIASVLQKRKPNQKVVISDAHQYLLDNHHLFDFVWSSPPCQTHTRMMKATKHDLRKYPDMKLYQEIIFLTHFFKGKFCVENVTPYYEPLIPGIKIGRHIFWTNFKITKFDHKTVNGFINGGEKMKVKLMDWLDIHYDENIYYGDNHDQTQVLRNCVHPEIGLSILNDAMGIINKSNSKQQLINF